MSASCKTSSGSYWPHATAPDVLPARDGSLVHQASGFKIRLHSQWNLRIHETEHLTVSGTMCEHVAPHAWTPHKLGEPAKCWFRATKPEGEFWYFMGQRGICRALSIRSKRNITPLLLSPSFRQALPFIWNRRIKLDLFFFRGGVRVRTHQMNRHIRLVSHHPTVMPRGNVKYVSFLDINHPAIIHLSRRATGRVPSPRVPPRSSSFPPPALHAPTTFS